VLRACGGWFLVGLVAGHYPSLVPLLAVVPGFVLTGLVDGGALGDALVVRAPGDDGAFGQIQDAFHGFAI
jgi:hypothetical protein